MNLSEIPVPAEAVPEPARARHAVLDHRLAAVVPLLDQRVAHAQAVALDGGATIDAHTDLREARDLVSECLAASARP